MMPIAGQVEDLLLLRRADRRQAVLRIPRVVVVSLSCSVGAALAVLGSGASSPAIEAPMEGEQG